MKFIYVSMYTLLFATALFLVAGDSNSDRKLNLLRFNHGCGAANVCWMCVLDQDGVPFCDGTYKPYVAWRGPYTEFVTQYESTVIVKTSYGAFHAIHKGGSEITNLFYSNNEVYFYDGGWYPIQPDGQALPVFPGSGPWRNITADQYVTCGINELDESKVSCTGMCGFGWCNSPVGGGYVDVAVVVGGSCALHVSGRIDCWGDTILGLGTRFALVGLPKKSYTTVTAVNRGCICALTASGQLDCIAQASVLPDVGKLNSYGPFDHIFEGKKDLSPVCLRRRQDQRIICERYGLLPANIIDVAPSLGFAIDDNGVLVDISNVEPIYPQHLIGFAPNTFAFGYTNHSVVYHASGQNASFWHKHIQRSTYMGLGMVISVSPDSFRAITTENKISAIGTSVYVAGSLPTTARFLCKVDIDNKYCQINTDNSVSCSDPSMSIGLSMVGDATMLTYGSGLLCALYPSGKIECNIPMVYGKPAYTDAQYMVSTGRQICAFDKNGTFYCFGSCSEARCDVAFDTTINSAVVGVGVNDDITCVITKDGRLWCSGKNLITSYSSFHHYQQFSKAYKECQKIEFISSAYANTICIRCFRENEWQYVDCPSVPFQIYSDASEYGRINNVIKAGIGSQFLCVQRKSLEFNCYDLSSASSRLTTQLTEEVKQIVVSDITMCYLTYDGLVTCTAYTIGPNPILVDHPAQASALHISGYYICYDNLAQANMSSAGTITCTSIIDEDTIIQQIPKLKTWCTTRYDLCFITGENELNSTLTCLHLKQSSNHTLSLGGIDSSQMELHCLATHVCIRDYSNSSSPVCYTSDNFTPTQSVSPPIKDDRSENSTLITGDYFACLSDQNDQIFSCSRTAPDQIAILTRNFSIKTMPGVITTTKTQISSPLRMIPRPNLHSYTTRDDDSSNVYAAITTDGKLSTWDGFHSIATGHSYIDIDLYAYDTFSKYGIYMLNQSGALTTSTDTVPKETYARNALVFDTSYYGVPNCFGYVVTDEGKITAIGQCPYGLPDTPKSKYVDVKLGFNCPCGLLANGSIACAACAEGPPKNIRFQKFVVFGLQAIYICGIMTENDEVYCWGTPFMNPVIEQLNMFAPFTDIRLMAETLFVQRPDGIVYTIDLSSNLLSLYPNTPDNRNYPIGTPGDGLCYVNIYGEHECIAWSLTSVKGPSLVPSSKDIAERMIQYSSVRLMLGAIQEPILCILLSSPNMNEGLTQCSSATNKIDMSLKHWISVSAISVSHTSTVCWIKDMVLKCSQGNKVQKIYSMSGTAVGVSETNLCATNAYDNKPLCWSYDSNINSVLQPTPEGVPALQQIAVGATVACGNSFMNDTTNISSLYCWQINTGTPVSVDVGSSISYDDICMGDDFLCGHVEGENYGNCWQVTPTSITLPPLTISPIVSTLSCAQAEVCGLDSNNIPHCFGSNDTETDISQLGAVSAIAPSYAAVCALGLNNYKLQVMGATYFAQGPIARSPSDMPTPDLVSRPNTYTVFIGTQYARDSLYDQQKLCSTQKTCANLEDATQFFTDAHMTFLLVSDVEIYRQIVFYTAFLTIYGAYDNITIHVTSSNANLISFAKGITIQNVRFDGSDWYQTDTMPTFLQIWTMGFPASLKSVQFSNMKLSNNLISVNTVTDEQTLLTDIEVHNIDAETIIQIVTPAGQPGSIVNIYGLSVTDSECNTICNIQNSAYLAISKVHINIVSTSTIPIFTLDSIHNQRCYFEDSIIECSTCTFVKFVLDQHSGPYLRHSMYPHVEVVDTTMYCTASNGSCIVATISGDAYVAATLNFTLRSIHVSSLAGSSYQSALFYSNIEDSALFVTVENSFVTGKSPVIQTTCCYQCKCSFVASNLTMEATALVDGMYSQGGVILFGNQTELTVDIANSSFSGFSTSTQLNESTCVGVGAALCFVAHQQTLNLNLANVQCSHNQAYYGGGCLYVRGNHIDASIVSSSFRNNIVQNKMGGAVILKSTCGDQGDCGFETGIKSEFTQSKFEDNSAPSGGAIAIEYTRYVQGTLDECEFKNNTATLTSGGAITIRIAGTQARGSGQITISRSSFSLNSAMEDGGAIDAETVALFTESTQFDSNIAGMRGGAMYLTDCTLQTQKTTFLHNVGTTDGGCLYITSSWRDIILGNGTIFNGCQSGLNGGAISILQSGLQSDNVQFIANTAIGQGGAISFSDTNDHLLINASSFINNTAHEGGAISLMDIGQQNPSTEYPLQDVSYKFTGLQMLGNNAWGYGGAIYFGGSSKFIVLSSTLVNNSAILAGGSIFTEKGTLDILHSVLNESSSMYGGGIFSPFLSSFNTSLCGNLAKKAGGAIFLHSTMHSYIFDNTSFENNNAEQYGHNTASWPSTIIPVIRDCDNFFPGLIYPNIVLLGVVEDIFNQTIQEDSNTECHLSFRESTRQNDLVLVGNGTVSMSSQGEFTFSHIGVVSSMADTGTMKVECSSANARQLLQPFGYVHHITFSTKWQSHDVKPYINFNQINTSKLLIPVANTNRLLYLKDPLTITLRDENNNNVTVSDVFCSLDIPDSSTALQGMTAASTINGIVRYSQLGFSFRQDECLRVAAHCSWYATNTQLKTIPKPFDMPLCATVYQVEFSHTELYLPVSPTAISIDVPINTQLKIFADQNGQWLQFYELSTEFTIECTLQTVNPTQGLQLISNALGIRSFGRNTTIAIPDITLNYNASIFTSTVKASCTWLPAQFHFETQHPLQIIPWMPHIVWSSEVQEKQFIIWPSNFATGQTDTLDEPVIANLVDTQGNPLSMHSTNTLTDPPKCYLLCQVGSNVSSDNIKTCTAQAIFSWDLSSTAKIVFSEIAIQGPSNILVEITAACQWTSNVEIVSEMKMKINLMGVTVHPIENIAFQQAKIGWIPTRRIPMSFVLNSTFSNFSHSMQMTSIPWYEQTTCSVFAFSSIDTMHHIELDRGANLSVSDNGYVHFDDVTVSTSMEIQESSITVEIQCYFCEMLSGQYQFNALSEALSLSWDTNVPQYTWSARLDENNNNLMINKFNPAPALYILRESMIEEPLGMDYTCKMKIIDSNDPNAKLIGQIETKSVLQYIQFDQVGIVAAIGSVNTIQVECSYSGWPQLQQNATIQIPSITLSIQSPSVFLQAESENIELSLGYDNHTDVWLAGPLNCHIAATDMSSKQPIQVQGKPSQVLQNYSSAVFEIALLDDRGANISLQAVCESGATQIVSPPQYVQMDMLQVSFVTQNSTLKLLPSSSAVRHYVDPPLELIMMRANGDRIGVDELVCMPLVQSTNQLVSLVGTPLDGYTPQQQSVISVGHTSMLSRQRNRQMWETPNLSQQASPRTLFSSVLSLAPLAFSGPLGTEYTFYIECVRNSLETLPTISIHGQLTYATFLVTEPPPSSIAPQTPFRLSLDIIDQDTNKLVRDDSQTECTLALVESSAPNARIQGNRAVARDGRVLFDGTSFAAVFGAHLLFSISCSHGDFVLESNVNGTDRYEVEMSACPPGQQPLGTQGYTCEQCPQNAYSDGDGEASCTQCPQEGADCSAGLLNLLDGYFFVPPEDSVNVTRSFAPTGELYKCKWPQACVVEPNTRVYRCASGYTGPLCGSCEIHDRYYRTTDGCSKCGSKVLQVLILVIIIICVLGALYYLAVLRRVQESQSTIIVRILMNFIMALGAMGVYRAYGTKTFRAAFAFSETVGSSTLSAGFLDCIFPLSYYKKFAVTLSLPLIAMCIAITFKLAHTFIKFGNMRSIKSYFLEHHYVAPAVIVLFLSYSVVTTESMKMLGCMDVSIGGNYYLAADTSVQCYTPAHIAAVAVAVSVLCVIGLGFPLGLIFALRRYKNKLSNRGFFEKFGFLYSGYSAKRSFYWWEGLNLIRKACIVLFGVVITDELYSLCAAILLSVVALSLQLSLRPYDRRLHNRLEALALSAVVFTQILSIIYLRSQTLNSGSSSGQLDRTNLVVTVVLCLCNFTVLALLVAIALKLRIHESPRVVDFVQRSSRKLTGESSWFTTCFVRLFPPPSAPTQTKHRSRRYAMAAPDSSEEEIRNKSNENETAQTGRPNQHKPNQHNRRDSGVFHSICNPLQDLHASQIGAAPLEASSPNVQRSVRNILDSPLSVSGEFQPRYIRAAKMSNASSSKEVL